MVVTRTVAMCVQQKPPAVSYASLKIAPIDVTVSNLTAHSSTDDSNLKENDI